MEHRNVLALQIPDQGADAIVPILRVPDDHTYTVEKCYAAVGIAMGGSTANYWMVNLYNGGTAGDATTVISGTAGSTAGWAANTAKELTITAGAGDLTAGQWLTCNYAETGTVAQLGFTLVVEYVDGIGSTA